MTTRSNIIAHYNGYPKLEIVDLFKYLYQSSFGCEHLISSPERTLEYINSELSKVKDREWKVDALDGSYSRIHLSSVMNDLSPEILSKYFTMSQKHEEKGKEELIAKLNIARKMIIEGIVPFSISDFDLMLDKWQKAGYPAIHHSDRFREEYAPAYRVIANEFLPLLYSYAH